MGRDESAAATVELPVKCRRYNAQRREELTALTDRRDWATVNADLLANLTDELREAFEGYYAKGDLARLLNVEALLRKADRAPSR